MDISDLGEQQKPTLYDLARTQAWIIKELGEGSPVGAIGERVAASVTRSLRIGGIGRDLRRPAATPPDRTAYVGLDAPGPGEPGPVVRRSYADAAARWPAALQNRYRRFLAEPNQLGEVKTRMLDRRFDPARQLLDTRGGGPRTAFFPLVDFHVVVLLDVDGDVVLAREIAQPEMVDYVAGDVGRGGLWNYKIAVGIKAMDGVGKNLTAAARKALRVLRA